MDKSFKITSDNLLAVEGKDECNFFKALLEYLDIKKVQLVDIGGKDKFADEFGYLYGRAGFSSVKQIGFVRDAEEKPAQSAFQSICGILKKKGLPAPDKPNQVIEKQGLKIGVYIMPDNKGTGMLENLCLQTIQGKPINDCIQNYIQCFKEYQTEEEKKKYNDPKACVQTYLASRSPIKNSLGLGALKGYWNFEHQCFEDIKKFLKRLFEDTE
ncbi:MAG: hypothetical protein JRJ44_01585 [Deltaproteobacteria bacterium]|nr:hypothetical protein [Deltaproteobacteria bacterium]